MTTTKPPGKARNHHFLPECYLKGWTSADGRLVEFAVRYEGVRHRWSSPGGTGYERDLYYFPALGGQSDALESDLLALIDSSAATALYQMRMAVPLQPSSRVAFARLLTTFLVRSPPSIHALKPKLVEWRRKDRAETQAIYETFIWKPGLPHRAADHLYATDTGEDDEEFLAETLRALLTHQKITEYLVGMTWKVLRVPIGIPSLLTSDQPLVTSKGLDAKNSYLLLPIGPRTVFLATNSRLYANRFVREWGLRKLTTHINQLVAERARRFVYSDDTSQAGWIGERFGTSKVPTLGETLSKNDPWGAGRSPNYSPDDAIADYIEWVSKNMASE